jgi:hypothetical protein
MTETLFAPRNQRTMRSLVVEFGLGVIRPAAPVKRAAKCRPVVAPKAVVCEPLDVEHLPMFAPDYQI